MWQRLAEPVDSATGSFGGLGFDFYTKSQYNMCRVRTSARCAGQCSKDPEEVTVAVSPQTAYSPSRLGRVFCVVWGTARSG
jgi:hypothetical protein